jgi:2',3'-cyclic-nucleotide 2'-phosphodiesterase (5'-nucleotidase family)
MHVCRFPSLLLLGLAVACASAPVSEIKDPVQSSEAKPSSPRSATKSSTIAHIKIIGISDFHGWLLPLEPKGYKKYFGGIANLGGTLTHLENISEENDIILDNGDMFTGPTESTFLRGEPVIQAYNALGVDAANVANHEFDFGLEVLKARATEANFPFLGANILQAGLDVAPSFLKPWIMLERQSIKIGVIGLSYENTPETTLATHVQGLEFHPYLETLQRVIPEIKKAGAEVIVVLFHDEVDVAVRALEKDPSLGIHLVIAGQNHRKAFAKAGNTLIVNPGAFGRSYVRFDIQVEKKSRKIRSLSHTVVDVTGEVGNPSFPPDAQLSAIAEAARQKVQTQAGQAIGTLSRPLPVGRFTNSPAGHLVVDAWLSAFPQVDFAICNHGALRQGLGKGEVKITDVISMLPFENNLFIVKITGKQLKRQLIIDHPVVAGLSWKFKKRKSGRKLISAVDSKGRPIADAKTYTVIINDFMYLGGDGFEFKDLDATPQDTGLSLREPILRVLRKAKASGKAWSSKLAARAVRVR